MRFRLRGVVVAFKTASTAVPAVLTNARAEISAYYRRFLLYAAKLALAT